MKDEDIKKIFSVAWVKERKILVGTVAVIAVIGFIIFITVYESDYAKCIKEVEREKDVCLYQGTGCVEGYPCALKCYEDSLCKKNCLKKAREKQRHFCEKPE